MKIRSFSKRLSQRPAKALARTLWLGLALLGGAPYGCSSTDCSTTLSCTSDDEDSDNRGGDPSLGGEPGSGGRMASSGGGASGGEMATPGGEGGVAGDPMKPSSPTVPEVVSLTVGGEELGHGGSLKGLRSGPQMVFRFSEPMDKGPTEAAYGSRDAAIKNANVTFKWNADATVLTIIPDQPLGYFETADPLETAPVLSVRLSTVARSVAGQELEEDFEASFSLLRRVSYFVPIDGENSVFSADPLATDPGVIPYGSLPHGIAPWFYCGAGEDIVEGQVIQKIGYEYPGYYYALAGYTVNVGTKNVGVISFLLSDIDAVEVESAQLKLLRWRSATGNTEFWQQSSEEPFSVDALRSQTLTLETLSSPSQRSNLVNSDGDAFPVGYGVFDFEVKGLIESALDQGDEWAMYRLEFDESADWDVDAGEYSSMCASLALTIQYLSE